MADPTDDEGPKKPQADNSAFTIPKAKPEKEKEKKDPMLELIEEQRKWVSETNEALTKLGKDFINNKDGQRDEFVKSAKEKLGNFADKAKELGGDASKLFKEAGEAMSKFASAIKGMMPSMSPVSDSPKPTVQAQQEEVEMQSVGVLPESSEPQTEVGPVDPGLGRSRSMSLGGGGDDE